MAITSGAAGHGLLGHSEGVAEKGGSHCLWYYVSVEVEIAPLFRIMSCLLLCEGVVHSSSILRTVMENGGMDGQRLAKVKQQRMWVSLVMEASIRE